MSLYTVARDDFKNAARSYIVLGVIGVFAALVGLIFVAEIDIYPHPYRVLFDVSFFIFLVFPLILAPLSYLAVAGDRERGTIKYALGLPNSRLEYVAGKLVSRLGVALAGTVAGVGVGYLIAVLTFDVAPSLERFLLFAAVSALYVVSLVGLYLGISTVTAKRSRAMLGVFAAYFVLVPVWFGFLPIIGLPALFELISDTFGVTISSSTQAMIQSLSPATAYLQSTDVVYHGVMNGQYPSIANAFPDSQTRFYQQFWFNSLVMVAWGVGTMVVGYLSFRRSELG